MFVENSPKYMRTIGDDSVSFEAVNSILKAGVLVSDEEDEADSAPGTDRRVRIRPGFRSNQVCKLYNTRVIDTTEQPQLIQICIGITVERAIWSFGC